jgi:hypothetical protein
MINIILSDQVINLLRLYYIFVILGRIRQPAETTPESDSGRAFGLLASLKASAKRARMTMIITSC